jgi:hypothetical protein
MNGQDRESEHESSQLADLLARDAPRRARPGLLEDVLARTSVTPQLDRRRWWPVSARSRGGPLDLPKLAMAGLLILVIGSGLVAFGDRLAGRGPRVGASSEASPRPAWATDTWNARLEPGVPYYFDLPARVIFRVPAGWNYLYSRDYGSVIANDLETAAVGWFPADNLFRDPCHWQAGTVDPPVGPTVDDMVSALEKMPGFVVVGPTRDVIGGLPAQSLALVLTVDESACDGSQVKVFSSTPTGGKFDPKPGTTTVRLLDVGGTRLAVTSWTPLLDPAGATSDIDAIVRSMLFQ